MVWDTLCSVLDWPRCGRVSFSALALSKERQTDSSNHDLNLQAEAAFVHASISGATATPDQPSTPDPSSAVRVSIVTIFFNAEPYLAEAIESVLAQNFRNFELILVDDGSTDGSTAIALAYADRYQHQIRYLEHRGHVNRGMSASRNVGVSAARGDLIALMDADDVWRPYKLSEQIAIIDAHPEVAMVCGAARYWKSWVGGEDRMVRSGHVQNVVALRSGRRDQGLSPRDGARSMPF